MPLPAGGVKPIGKAAMLRRWSAAQCDAIAARLAGWCTALAGHAEVVSGGGAAEDGAAEIVNLGDGASTACYVAMCGVAVERALACPSHAASLRLAGQLLSRAIPLDAAGDR
jgi:hypothetical protein